MSEQHRFNTYLPLTALDGYPARDFTPRSLVLTAAGVALVVIGCTPQGGTPTVVEIARPATPIEAPISTPTKVPEPTSTTEALRFQPGRVYSALIPEQGFGLVVTRLDDSSLLYTYFNKNVSSNAKNVPPVFPGYQIQPASFAGKFPETEINGQLIDLETLKGHLKIAVPKPGGQPTTLLDTDFTAEHQGDGLDSFITQAIKAYQAASGVVLSPTQMRAKLEQMLQTSRQKLPNF